MLIRFAQYVLHQFLAVGQLSIALGDGPMHPITAGTAGPQAAIRLTHRRVLWRLMLHPDLAFGESYMDGDLQIESGDIDDLMALLVANREHWQNHWLARLVLALDTRLARFSGLNFPGRAKRNVAHHYDLKDSLFDNFLDPWRQYSCAYFRSPDEPLADAQITKLSRIAAKLRLQPHDHVLDIGCGWGGLAFALATVEPEAKVTGITLSENQLAFASDAVRTTPQANRISFALRDYRQQTGRFDKIVSVGMLEHVGAKHYDSYFASIARLLAADGLALVHSIAVSQRPRRCNRWINKYIFPGGYLPSLEQVSAAAIRHGLKITDVEIMSGHYEETLKQWRQAFFKNCASVRQHYDDRFIRMWEFYLAGCEYFFRSQAGMVCQLQLSHSYHATPLGRRYISQQEDKYRDILCKTDSFGKPPPSTK